MIKIGAIIVLAGAIGGYFIKQKTAKPVEEEQVTQVNAPVSMPTALTLTLQNNATLDQER